MLDSAVVIRKIEQYMRETTLSNEAISEIYAVMRVIQNEGDEFDAHKMLWNLWHYTTNGYLSEDVICALDDVAIIIQEECNEGLY